MGPVSDSLDRRELLELVLRPLGALGPAEEFPQDRAGIEALIEHLPKGRPSEPEHFAFEDGKALPRYDGERTIWLSAAGDGALRVRRQISVESSASSPSSSTPTAGSATSRRSRASASPTTS